jgi:hypothetical protein
MFAGWQQEDPSLEVRSSSPQPTGDSFPTLALRKSARPKHAAGQAHRFCDLFEELGQSRETRIDTEMW